MPCVHSARKRVERPRARLKECRVGEPTVVRVPGEAKGATRGRTRVRAKFNRPVD